MSRGVRVWDPTITNSSTKSGTSRYLGSTAGQDCCRTSPLCWRRRLRGFFTWQRPGRDPGGDTQEENSEENCREWAGDDIYSVFYPVCFLIRSVKVKSRWKVKQQPIIPLKQAFKCARPRGTRRGCVLPLSCVVCAWTHTTFNVTECSRGPMFLTCMST